MAEGEAFIAEGEAFTGFDGPRPNCLEIHVMGARNLKAMDVAWSGTRSSDPKVKKLPKTIHEYVSHKNFQITQGGCIAKRFTIR